LVAVFRCAAQLHVVAGEVEPEPARRRLGASASFRMKSNRVVTVALPVVGVSPHAAYSPAMRSRSAALASRC
jgi:hypothetical protein